MNKNVALWYTRATIYHLVESEIASGASVGKVASQFIQATPLPSTISNLEKPFSPQEVPQEFYTSQ
jgi:hypothetical protein